MSKINKKLRALSTDKLKSYLKITEFEQMKATSAWAIDGAEKSKAGMYRAAAKKGESTSMQKDLRRHRARIITILRERAEVA